VDTSGVYLGNQHLEQAQIPGTHHGIDLDDPHLQIILQRFTVLLPFSLLRLGEWGLD